MELSNKTTILCRSRQKTRIFFSIGAARENYFGLLTAQALNTYLITIGGCKPTAFFLEQFIPGITI